MKKFTSWGEFVVVLTKTSIIKNVVVCPEPNYHFYHLLEYPNGDVTRIETTEIIAVMRPREFAKSYVNTLPNLTQSMIRKRLEWHEELSAEDVENGMCSREVDLEDTINVYGTYINELVEIRKDTFPAGTTVVLLTDIDDPFKCILKGTKGVVQSVDDIGTVHVRWETGLLLGALLSDLLEVV